MTGKYASKTKVPAQQSRMEIERQLVRYGATAFAYLTEQKPNRAVIMFSAKDRRVRFDLPLPDIADEQATRQRWRALVLCIKAKLESVDSRIETFEEAFLAHVVLPDGSTVGEHVKPTIAQAYLGGGMVPLLPPPTKVTK